jgi:hypothetical protein
MHLQYHRHRKRTDVGIKAGQMIREWLCSASSGGVEERSYNGWLMQQIDGVRGLPA